MICGILIPLTEFIHENRHFLVAVEILSFSLMKCHLLNGVVCEIILIYLCVLHLINQLGFCIDFIMMFDTLLCLVVAVFLPFTDLMLVILDSKQLVLA